MIGTGTMGGFLVTIGILYLSVFLLSTFPLALGLVFGLGGLAGMLGWLVYLLRRFAQRKERTEFDDAHPLPRMQVWMQDMYAVVFYFAIYMAVIYGSGKPAQRDALEVAATVVYLLLAIVVSLLLQPGCLPAQPEIAAPVAAGAFYCRGCVVHIVVDDRPRLAGMALRAVAVGRSHERRHGPGVSPGTTASHGRASLSPGGSRRHGIRQRSR